MRIRSRVYKIIALMLLATTMLTGCGDVLKVKDTSFVKSMVSNQRTAFSVCKVLGRELLKIEIHAN